MSHVTDATDWRVEYPFVVLYPDTEEEVRGLVEGCIELGLTIIPRGGGTGYTGGAIPLTARSAVINTEKLERLVRRRVHRAAGPAQPVATIDAGAGVVTKRVMDAAENAGLVFRRGSDVRGCVLHRRQRRDERRRQEGGAVGHGAGQPGFVAHGDAGRRVAGGRPASTTTSAKIHDARGGHASSCARLARDGRTVVLRPKRSSCRRAFPQGGPGQGRHRQVSLGGLPGVQKEGCDGIITSARFVLHRMPPAIRTVCLEFFGQVRDSTPAIVEIKNYLDDAASWRAYSRASSISTSAM